MARKDVDINVNVDVNNAQKGLNSFSNTWTELSSAMGLAQQAFGYVQQALDATVGEYMEQADAVRTLAQFTGVSYEETSKLIQVFDDAGVGADKLKMGMKFLSEKGLEPSIDTIARLSDEYQKIQSPTERVAFLMKRFGSEGAELGKIFDLTGDSIRDAGEAVADSLVFDEEKIKMTEELRIAQDELNDSIQASKNIIAQQLIPAMSSLTETTTGYLSVQQKFFSAPVDNYFKLWKLGIDSVKSGYLEIGIALTGLIRGTENADKLRASIEGLDASALAASIATGALAGSIVELDEEIEQTGITAFDQYNTAINNVNAAQENNAIATWEARNANVAMFDSINTGLDNMITKWMDDYEWISNGGLLLQQQFETLKKAWAEPGADQAAIKEDMDDLYAKTEALNVAIGKIDASTAAQNIADTLGVSIGEAHQLLSEFLASLSSGGTLTVDVDYNDPGFMPSTTGNRGSGTGRGIHARAAGGMVDAGQPYWVGEQGPEPFVPSTDGRILSTQDAKSALSGGGGGINIAPGAIVINGAGDAERIAQLVIEKVKSEAARARRSGSGSY